MVRRRTHDGLQIGGAVRNGRDDRHQRDTGVDPSVDQARQRGQPLLRRSRGRLRAFQTDGGDGAAVGMIAKMHSVE